MNKYSHILFVLLIVICTCVTCSNADIILQRVIIKFNSKTVVPLDDKELFLDEYLNHVNLKYQLVQIDPVFKATIDYEALKKKFPKRAARMPKDGKKVALDSTYVFSFASDENVDLICEAYKQSAYVVYAEADKLMRLTK